MQILTLTCI